YFGEWTTRMGPIGSRSACAGRHDSWRAHAARIAAARQRPRTLSPRTSPARGPDPRGAPSTAAPVQSALPMHSLDPTLPALRRLERALMRRRWTSIEPLVRLELGAVALLSGAFMTWQ